MNRCVLIVAIVACCGSVALADYYDPPEGWSTNPYFTHQVWEFSTADNPAFPEPGYVNDNGEPSAELTGDQFWIDDPSAYVPTDRRGMWVVGEFETPTSANVQLIIPNDPAMPEKLVWAQFTYYLTGAPGAGYITDLLTWGGEQVTVVPGSEVAYAIDPINEPDWFYYEIMWSVEPQPDQEIVDATINLPAMAVFAMDEAAVDTICIPEPTTIWLLGFGGCLWLRRRR